MIAAMAEAATYPLREFRCQCGRYLFKARLSPGSLVQITCRSCKENMTIYVPDVDDGDDIT